MNLRTIIIEDDESCRTLLTRHCENTKLIDIIGTFDNALDALNSGILENAELIFLDIEMPHMTGLQFMEQLKCQPSVVFTTSNDQYAVEAFNHRAIDFLQKPISRFRFQQTLAVALEHQLNNSTNAPVATAEESKNIFIKESGRWIRVGLDEILYFENEGDYVKIITSAKNHLIYRTMKSIAETVRGKRFLRIHRSFIVNLDKIVDIEDNSLVIAKKVIPIGKAHKGKLMRALNTL